MKQRDDVSEYEALLALSTGLDPKAREWVVELLAELRKETKRLDFMIAVTTADGAAEDDPSAVAMAMALMQGLDGRAAIDAAIAKAEGES